MPESKTSKKTTVKTLKPSDFVHLHNHTHHSLLDGLQKIKPMIQRVKELGMGSVAITDHGTLSGAIDFYKAAQSLEVKPIIGIETYVANRNHTDKDPQKDRSRYHMLLFAMNNTGYKNLMKLSSIANLEGYYYKPRVDKDLLKKYNQGIIATSGCIGGEIGEMFRNDQDDKAEEAAKWFLDVFGDRFYFEIQDHGLEWDEQKKVNDKVIALADKYNAPLVLTGDAHYRLKEDQEAHEILLCVQTGSSLDDSNRFSLKDTDLHLKDPKEIIKRWGDLRPDAIRNTSKLAQRCDVSIKLGDILIPKFDVPKGFSEKSFLHQSTYQGLAWRYGGIEKSRAQKIKTNEAKKLLEPHILERAEYELGIIGNMGFDGYFLIVADFIYWGKSQGIVFGPGRGSAAGSIVAYGMEITDLDPIKYDLLFERFLNPDRISMPDIDIDIQDNRRDEVIQYCVEKYGQDRVAHIVTFGKMAARNAIRDVARVLNIAYAEADRLAKMVPPPIQGRHIPLELSIKDDPSLKSEYETNPQSKRIFDLAIRLEGTIRSHGVHAAGVVIAPDEITNYTPLEMAQKGVVTTQYPMNPVEELGLLKMDFLGLSNLTIINNALRIIKKVYNTEIDIGTLELDDKKTYELLGNGMTTGVFQLESAGMKRYLKQLKPTVFDDIIAMAALYRPGPLTAGLTDSFVKRKNGKEKVSYPHEKMKQTLGNTFGVLVYQEQVMEISKNVCGFTGGEADTLRKAIGKKKRDVMEKMKVQFIDGGVNHGGVDRGVMVKFWDDLMGFADYAFNKSHSACYALIAYQTAYLKAHYPAAFMAALMTSDFDDTDRLTIEITECKKLGLEVVAPDVNESFVEFAVVPNSKKIRYGMAAIKNVGRGAVEEILRARKEGKFSSIEDFASRVNPRIVTKKAWESLIKAGAFDELEPNRGKLLINMETILSFSQKIHKEALSGQEDLFGGSLAPEINPVLNLEEPPTQIIDSEKLQWEKELLGIYLSSHPLDPFGAYLDEQTMPLGSLNEGHDNRSASIGGVTTTIREITTKKGNKMAFVGLEDKTGSIELVVFPGAYEGKESIWQPDKIIHAQGKFNAKDRNGNTGDLKVLVDDVIELDIKTAEAYKSTGKKKRVPRASVSQSLSDNEITKKVFIKLENPDSSDQELKQLRGLVEDYKGMSEVIVVIDRASRQAVRLPFRVDGSSEELILKLNELFGPKNVIVK